MIDYAVRNATEALRLAKTAERARDLFARGYRYSELFDRLFAVMSPEGNRYYVDLLNKRTCTCPDFAKHKDFCKHLLAVTQEVEMNEALCEEYDRQALSELDYDPYASAACCFAR